MCETFGSSGKMTLVSDQVEEVSLCVLVVLQFKTAPVLYISLIGFLVIV